MIIYIFIFIIGLVFGSFYNVVGLRLPNKESIIMPGSHCTMCKHKIKFYDNIPVLSYIFLRGKCRYCNEKISIIYPIFELITGLLFLLCFIKFGFSLKFISSIIIISTLIVISISDIKYYIIPDSVLIFGSLLLIIVYITSCILYKYSFYTHLLLPIIHGISSFALLYIFARKM